MRAHYFQHVASNGKKHKGQVFIFHSFANPVKYEVQTPLFFQRIEMDIIHRRRYFSSMKIKTSITLWDEVLKAIDLHMAKYKSRSEFLETAARKFIVQLARKEAEQRDLEIINRRADSLDAEAEDVLTYQVTLRDVARCTGSCALPRLIRKSFVYSSS